MTGNAAADRASTYLRSAGLALLALPLGFGTFILKLSNEGSDAAWYFGVAVFLVVLPVMHVYGMLLATRGIGRGHSRFRGFLCLILHVAIIFLGILFGAGALIGASA